MTSIENIYFYCTETERKTTFFSAKFLVKFGTETNSFDFQIRIIQAET